MIRDWYWGGNFFLQFFKNLSYNYSCVHSIVSNSQMVMIVGWNFSIAFYWIYSHHHQSIKKKYQSLFFFSSYAHTFFFSSVWLCASEKLCSYISYHTVEIVRKNTQHIQSLDNPNYLFIICDNIKFSLKFLTIVDDHIGILYLSILFVIFVLALYFVITSCNKKFIRTIKIVWDHKQKRSSFKKKVHNTFSVDFIIIIVDIFKIFIHTFLSLT